MLIPTYWPIRFQCFSYPIGCQLKQPWFNAIYRSVYQFCRRSDDVGQLVVDLHSGQECYSHSYYCEIATNSVQRTNPYRILSQIHCKSLALSKNMQNSFYVNFYWPVTQRGRNSCWLVDISVIADNFLFVIFVYREASQCKLIIVLTCSVGPFAQSSSLHSWKHSFLTVFHRKWCVL